MTSARNLLRISRQTMARAGRFGFRLLSDPRETLRRVYGRVSPPAPANIEVECLLSRRPKGGPTLVHIANYNANAGDMLLTTVLRDLVISQCGPVVWEGIHAHKPTTDQTLRDLNRSRGVIVGGGGLFLRDTGPNPNSGWQWNCSIDGLKRIKVPLVLFAVGYNRFRGQPDFEPIFRDHLAATAEKAMFLGLRNGGSIRAVQSYLPQELHAKLRYQPCMTTLLRLLYPALIASETERASPFVALNCAFDRPELRFGPNQAARLDSIAEAMWRISRHLPVKYYSHMRMDEEILPHLDRRGVPYELVPLQGLPPDQIVRAYARPALTIGMRGHAQLVPFGCSRPIVSLISHDKLRYFLEDISAEDWGVEIDDPDLVDRLTETTFSILERPGETQSRLTRAQDALWDVTIENLNAMAVPMGLKRPRHLSSANR